MTMNELTPEERAKLIADGKKVLAMFPGTEASPDLEVADTSEDALAQLFALRHPEFRWVQRWGRWYEWDGTVWRTDEKLAVFNAVRALLREIAGSDKRSRDLKKSATVAAIERLARGDLVSGGDIWDRDGMLLNTPGGIVDLRSGKVYPHDPERWMTKITAAAPGGQCPRWHRFLDDVTDGDRELQAFLQRVAGYALTGSVKEHSLFFFYGTGRNGKGVFLNTLTAIMSDYAGIATIEALMQSRNDRHPTELASLMGKRLVVAQEVEDGGQWAESRIKTLTGGDPITARFMRGDFFTFDPQFKLIVAGNHKPSFRSLDVALRARLHLVPFTVTIPPDQRDPDLPEKLREEAGGILQWAIEGAAAWHEEGLCPPEAVKAATDEYFEEQDIFQQWIEESCEVGADYWETPTPLFNSWKQFAEASGISPGTSSAFKGKMEGAGFRWARTKLRGRHYVGIRLSAPETDPDEHWKKWG